MTETLGQLLARPPRYGIGAAAVPYRADLPVYIRITDIDEYGRFRADPRVSVDSPLSSGYLLRNGDLVIARTGASVGKSYRYRPSDGPLVFAGFLIAVHPDNKRLDPRYLEYLLQSKRYWDWVAAESTRSGQPGINAQQIAQMSLDLPKIEDQRAIADVVEDVDRLIDVLERAILKKRSVRHGIMSDLLTARRRLPGYAERWREVRLGDHVSFLRTVPLSREQLDTGSALKYLHYGDIHGHDGVRLDAVREDMPRASARLAGRADRLTPGDLIFADASEDLGGVGKSVEIVAVPAGGVVSGMHTIAARFDKDVLADGFKAYLQYIPAFRESLARLAAGTKVLATSRNNIASVSLLLPETGEQAAIAAVLADADAEIAGLERRLGSTRALKVGMMQRLLVGRKSILEEVVA